MKSQFLESSVDIIKTFPCNYMHMLCLGIAKRLLTWISLIDHITIGTDGRAEQDPKDVRAALDVHLRNSFPRTADTVAQGESISWQAEGYGFDCDP